jgi:hypothetical protein
MDAINTAYFLILLETTYANGINNFIVDSQMLHIKISVMGTNCDFHEHLYVNR